MNDIATADYIVAFLNELVKVDPKALQALIESRVECNEIIAKHPSVQVQTTEQGHRLGVLGLLNGLVGSTDSFIAASFDKSGQLIGFTILGSETTTG